MNGRQSIGHQIGKFQRLHQIGVPHEAAIRHFEIVHFGGDFGHLLDTLFEGLVSTKYSGVRLHRALHLKAQLGRRRASLAWRAASKRSNALSMEAWFSSGFGVFGSTIPPARMAAARPNTTRSISELDPKRLAPCTEAQPASPTAIRPGTIAFGSVAVGFRTCPVIVGRDAAHVVVHRRQNRDRLLGHIHARERFWQLSEMPGRRSARADAGRWLEVKENVVFVFGPTPRPSRISMVMERDT